MKKVLLISFMVLALALVLSSCMKTTRNTTMSIRDAISAAASSTVSATVVGVVTDGYGDYVVIQDNTAAIEVYLKGSSLGNTYTRGEKLEVFGTVQNYKNNWEIVPPATSNVIKIGTGTVNPTPIPTNTALGVKYDWMLMKVTNLPVEKIADKYYDVVLKNGSADITIFSYDSDVRKWLTSLSTGDIVSVQGNVRYTYGWKLVLRDINDK